MPEIEAEFGGELRRFVMTAGGLRKVQERCGAGPLVVLERIGSGAWLVDDIREPIYQGRLAVLQSPNEAAKEVREWIDDMGLKGFMENASLAIRVLSAGLVVPEAEREESEDPASGEPQGVASSAAPTARSTSAASTSPPAPSASPSPKSTEPNSGSSTARSPATTAPIPQKTRSRRPAQPSTTA